MRRLQGYSLLEMLIVLTIISTLAVVAVPMYLNYDVRAKVTEGLVVAGPVKRLVEDYYQTMGDWPPSRTAAGLDPPNSYKTRYVDNIAMAVNLTDIKITITYSLSALAGNNTLVLTPQRNNNAIVWSCKGGSLANKYRPPVCQS